MTTLISGDESPSQPFRLGRWTVQPDTGVLSCTTETLQLEPKLMAVLLYFVANPGRVLARREIEAAVWPGQVVGDDTVARAISRLRRALGDTPQTPAYIETLPRRGYRLVAAVTAGDAAARAASRRGRITGIGAAVAMLGCLLLILLFVRPGGDTEQSDSPTITMTARADDYYMRFTRQDNEAALALYERVLAAEPSNTRAQAGVANALVQRVIRWPAEPEDGARSLREALQRGLHEPAAAQEALLRATAMAERAARRAPRDPDVQKALGLTYAAQGRFDAARRRYEEAISIDPDAWEAMINLGELHQIDGDSSAALAVFEQAYLAMERSYATEPQRIGPWQAALGVAIGRLNEERGAPAVAENWYRRVLEATPFEPEATTGLARMLRLRGAADKADELCDVLTRRVGAYPGCATD